MVNPSFPPELLVSRASQRRLQPPLFLIPIGIFGLQLLLDRLDFGAQRGGPSRAIVELDDVALGVRSDPHRAAPGARALLLSRWRLGVRVVRVLLVRFMMSDRASRRSSELAMARHVAGDAAGDGPLDASFGFRR